MADMKTLDPQWIAALALLAAALVVAGGLPLAPKWRGLLKKAAIGVFSVALAVVLVEIGFWLASGRP